MLSACYRLKGRAWQVFGRPWWRGGRWVAAWNPQSLFYKPCKTCLATRSVWLCNSKISQINSKGLYIYDPKENVILASPWWLIFNPSILKAKSGRTLWGGGQNCLQSKFHDKLQDNTETPCQKKTNKQKIQNKQTTKKTKVSNTKSMKCQVVVAHAFNHSILKAEAATTREIKAHQISNGSPR